MYCYYIKGDSPSNSSIMLLFKKIEVSMLSESPSIINIEYFIIIQLSLYIPKGFHKISSIISDDKCDLVLQIEFI